MVCRLISFLPELSPCYLDVGRYSTYPGPKFLNYIRISQLEAYTAQYNLDVIALTESALRPTDQCDKIKIPGYTILRRELPAV